MIGNSMFNRMMWPGRYKTLLPKCRSHFAPGCCSAMFSRVTGFCRHAEYNIGRNKCEQRQSFSGKLYSRLFESVKKNAHPSHTVRDGPSHTWPILYREFGWSDVVDYAGGYFE